MVGFNKCLGAKLCKMVGCSCVWVKDYGKELHDKDAIEECFKCKK